MKKILMVFLIFMLVGCGKSITRTIYASSIGIEVKDEEIVCYFFINPVTEIKQESNKDVSYEYIKVNGKTFTEVFMNAQKSISLDLNFMHIKTAIFHTSFLESDYIDKFLDFMYEEEFFTVNFYVLSTNEKMDDIFSFKVPNDINYMYFLLSSPSAVDYHLYGAEEISFLSFANKYYNDNRYIHIPYLKINNYWNDKTLLEVDGYMAYKNKKCELFLNSFYKCLSYLYSNSLLIIDFDDTTYKLVDYKVYNQVISDVFTITLSSQTLSYKGSKDKNDLKNYLYSIISGYFDSYIELEQSLYFITDYNYLENKKIDTKRYQLLINI